MANDWKIQQFPHGILLPQIDLWLDARIPQKCSFISHAHFDHMARHQKVITSQWTGRLMRARLSGLKESVELPYHQHHLLETGTELQLYPAGHILGSAQLLLKSELGSLLYSGDFKLRDGLSSEPCQPVPADVLIMETTYGLPQYIFPPSQEVMADIIKFCIEAVEDNKVPVLFGYSLGKSQELLSCLSQAELPIVLHSSIYRMTEIYKKLGVKFPPYAKFSGESLSGKVLLFPPNANRSSALQKISNRVTAAITGWALNPGAVFRYQCDAVFPLSDHADFNDLVRYVELVKPKKVYTVHGSAKEFALHLRNLGFEAWALTGDNQLEFDLLQQTKTPQLAKGGEAILQPNRELQQLARLLDECSRITGVISKVEMISKYFLDLVAKETGERKLSLAVNYLSGRAFPQNNQKKLNVGIALLRRVVSQVAGRNKGEIREVYLRHQDTGSAFEELLQGYTQPGSHFSLIELDESLSLLADARNPGQKLKYLQALFLDLEPTEIKWVAKFITGDLRAGVKEGVIEEAIGKAFSYPADSIKDASMLLGDLGQTAIHAHKATLDRIKLSYFSPIKPMLASPEKDAEALMTRSQGRWYAEDKMDGIRCQLHRKGNEIQLFSRDLNRINTMFSEILEAALSLKEDCVLDGELVAFQDEKALPFASLQKRLGRKEIDLFLEEDIPVCYFAFDCMKRGEEMLIYNSWRKRQIALQALLSDQNSSHLRILHYQLAESTQKIEELFCRARRVGNEGLILKNPESNYSPGRRGMQWLKLKKAYATIDAVVIAVEQGHGKRKEYLSDYTFAVKGRNEELLTIGKAYSGLSNQELEEMTEVFKGLTIEVSKGRYHKVEPRIVVEIAFDSIQSSKRHDSGLSLRFPRIHRLRLDKKADEIDTLDQCLRLKGDH
ncbi:MAG: ATP-dependent DNA ligase [Verrucomicrobiota bacterium]